MQSNPHKLTVIDGETLMDKRLPPTKFCVDTLLPQVTLFLLLSQIPSLTSLAFLHRMSDDAFIASFAFVLRPPKWRPQRRRAMPIPLSIIYERSLSVKEKNKNIILSFRVTPEEKTWIEEHSYGHYRRISDFVRDCIFKKEIVNIDGADEIAHELQRIGNNLNQLTRAVNAGFVRAVDLGETKREVQKVWQSLNSLFRDAR